ncbi:MAG: phosphopentomutase [candidate division Zixibacteria bacterium SM23_81]|nr:MAG: phosphopentomutase [candidate division Zixibacteria bacterium SM23_81]
MSGDSRRFILIVLDSVGIGELPDAHLYSDQGSNTLVNTARVAGGLQVPNLGSLGLGNIAPILGVPRVANPTGNFGKMAEKSVGKDSISGHWELMGLVTERPLPTYPDGFPPEVMEPFQEAIGRETLGNKTASGTVIIQELGQEHVVTGKPIVYTSADSVFQVAAHEEVIPLDELYRICEVAREQLTGKHAVGRVIARPFVGQRGNFTRTANRKDFSLYPPSPTLLDQLKEANLPVVGIGKIEDLFAGRGITQAIHTKSNQETMVRLREQMGLVTGGAILVNLVDFDMLWGHRNNPQAYAQGLKDFDVQLGHILPLMQTEDLLIITADHGNDPTTPSTDHSREYVPLLAYGPNVKKGVPLGVRGSFADVAATVAEFFQLPGTGQGQSFWGKIAGSGQ